MTAFTIHLKDALLTRITQKAVEFGDEPSTLVERILEEAFPATPEADTQAITPTFGQQKQVEEQLFKEQQPEGQTTGDRILAILTPIWDEEKVHPERFSPDTMPDTSKDPIENYLSQHWVEEIHKQNLNR